MVRFSLTICGLTILFGVMSGAQQNTAPPQTRTAEGFSVQQARPTPSPRPGVTPRIGPTIPAQGGAAPRSAQVQKPAPAANQPGATAPRKNPGVAGATTPQQTAPMGPAYPTPEIPQPSRPADMPPVPPQVTYKNGMLTVNAVNSTMSSLLTAIRSKTGIEFEGAENSSERVAINMGPAPEGEVLAGIFSGSNFDYVVLDRADSPGTVQRVILTPRGKPGGATMAGPPQPQQPSAQQQADEDTGEDADTTEQPDPQDSANQPPQVNQPPNNNENQQNQPESSGPKTPEQLLQELKQMQQQQQQQQGQPPPDTNSVPRKMPPK